MLSLVAWGKTSVIWADWGKNRFSCHFLRRTKYCEHVKKKPHVDIFYYPRSQMLPNLTTKHQLWRQVCRSCCCFCVADFSFQNIKACFLVETFSKPDIPQINVMQRPLKWEWFLSYLETWKNVFCLKRHSANNWLTINGNLGSVLVLLFRRTSLPLASSW